MLQRITRGDHDHAPSWPLIAAAAVIAIVIAIIAVLAIGHHLSSLRHWPALAMAVVPVTRGGRPAFKAMYRDGEGKQKSAGTYPTRKAAQAAYDRAKAAVLLGAEPPATPGTTRVQTVYPAARKGGVTVAGYAETWLPGHNLSAHSRQTYRSELTARILPRFGGSELAAVTSADVRAYFRTLEADKASGALLAKIKTVMSSLFQTALEDGLVTYNPVRGVKYQATTPARRKALTPGQFRALMENIPAHYELLVQTMIESGLRWEEATGLKGSDIDGAAIHIRRTLNELKNPHRWEEKPATKNGKPRTVTISAALAVKLRAAGQGWLFLAPGGGHIRREDFRASVWLPACKAAGVTGITARDLRRTHATWCREGGATLEEVRDRLGHGNVSVTDRYLGRSDDSERKALSAFENVLNGSAA